MADKSLKAVISAEFDPRGVVKGVAAANTELQKLNRTSGAVAASTRLAAGLQAMQMAFNVVAQVVQQVDRRMQELSEMAGRFSPEALSAKAGTKVAEIERDIKIGKTLGLDVAAAERIKQQSMIGEAERAQGMVGALSAWQSIKTDAETTWNKILEIPAKMIANDFQARGQPDDVSRFWRGESGASLTALPIGNRVEDRARAAQQQDEQTKYLAQIAKGVSGQ
jgi:hypothetical protein